MSSLSLQLSNIAIANQTVALDRKKRSKLHSVSFIYDPKFASTQDYDSIWSDAVEALTELVSIDKRFSRFHSTIFSETSINVDRMVQSKEQNDLLDVQITTFLYLLAPYWHLSVSLKAAEWPLRRFQMNVHTAEQLILSLLPYYDHPVFRKVLHVVPQQSFPNIFVWLTNFKKTGKLPSQNLLAKAFTDLDFHTFYSRFLIDQSAHGNTFNKQLVMFISCSVSSIVSLQANDLNKLSQLTPIVLETCGQLLKSANQDCRITAFALLAVLSKSIVLSRDVLFACIESVLTSCPLSRQSLACVLKLYQTLQSSEVLPFALLQFLKPIQTSEEFQDLIFNDIKYNSKFVTSYIRSCIVNKELNDSFLNNICWKFKTISKSNYKLVLGDLITLSPDRESASYFKWLISEDEGLFKETLGQNDYDLNKLEVELQIVLVANEQDHDEVIEDEVVKDEEPEKDLSLLFYELKTDVRSFLVSNSTVNSEFEKLTPLFFASIKQNALPKFIRDVFPSPESSISFLLRVITSTNIPTNARLQAMVLIRRRFKEILNRETSLFLLLPVLLSLLADNRQSIRTGAVELISTINDNEKDKVDSYFLSEDIYGSHSDQAATLDSKNIKTLYSSVLDNAALYKIDSEQVFVKLNHFLESDKKNNKLFYAVLVSHCLANNIPNVKHFLLKVVINGKLVVKGVSLPSQLFDEFLKNYLDDRSTWNHNCEKSNVDFVEFEKTVLQLISSKEKSHTAIELLTKAITQPEDEKLSTLGVDRLVEIFSSLKQEFQLEILFKIIDSESSIDPVDILQALNLPNEMFIQLLKKSTLTQSAESGLTVKRRRRSSLSTRQALKDSSVAKIATDHLKKITIILEVLVTSSIDDASYELLQRLFNVLTDLETLDNGGNLPVIYTQETLASCMLNVVNALKKGVKLNVKVDTSTVRADSIIATIRSSSTPQVQNKFLLVVAALASLAPETVLHSVMPIFTFMGAHTIRQDDEFSNHVVEQTIMCVVPALAATAENGQADEIEFLTTSFVSAFQHIPRHRRVKLFTTLAKTLGVEYSVSLILFLCGQQYSALYNKHKMADCRALLEFMSSFLKNFELHYQLSAILEFLKLWNSIPLTQLSTDSQEYKQLLRRSAFGVNILSLNKSELVNLRNNLLTFLDHSITGDDELSSLPHLRIKIAQILLDSDQHEVTKIDSAFSNLIQYVLNDLNAEEEQISHNIRKLLGNVLDLLPIHQFVDSVLSVIGEDTNTTDSKTKRHLAALIGNKFEVESSEDLFAQESAAKVIPVLVDIVEKQQSVELSQACLDSLSAVFQKFDNNLDSSLLIKCLSVVVGPSGLLYKESLEVMIASINCITNIISIVGVKMIGSFPKIVKPLFDLFYESQEFKDKEMVQVSILILFSCMIKKLPVFMLSSLKDVFKLIFDASTLPESTRLSILDIIVQHMNLREVLKSLSSIWGIVAELDAVAIGLYLHTMELTIENIDKKSASLEAIGFMKFLLYGFEYRSQSKFDSNTVNRIELSLFQCGVNYVMKLNDKRFRPLFASMSRWAFDAEGTVNEISEVDRLLAFFRFFNKLQENLKSIITDYYSYFLENVERLLVRYSSGEITEINLRRIVLISLTSSFKYDKDEFWSSETRFEVASQSLTDQLVNIEDGIGKYLVKAISTLAKSCSSEDHNKTMNALMMKHLTISGGAREKYWSARTMKMIYQKVGDQWLSLLPQLVPLIAELLDDDDEEVEHEVRTGLCKVIESVLGEPLDKYLN